MHKKVVGGCIHGVFRSWRGQGAFEVLPLDFAGAGAIATVAVEGVPEPETPSETQQFKKHTYNSKVYDH